jgi:major type 1 subunit fimbrin (pilin)
MFSLKYRHRQKRLNWSQLLKLGVLVALMALIQRAAYADNCTTNVSAINLSLPTGTYVVPRDTPVGSLLTPFTSFPTGVPYSNLWTCTEPGGVWAGPAAHVVGLTYAGMTYTAVTGVPYWVYQTNVEGVGLVVGVQNMLANQWFPPGWGMTTLWHRGNLVNNLSGNQPYGASAAFAYVKTGRINGGTVNMSGIVGELAMMIDGFPNEGIISIMVSGAATFVSAACTTPDVTVNMGRHKASEFSGPGSYASSTPFEIALNNCPAGMNSIKYSVDATTTILDPTQSVVALNGSSTATGIGIQLLDKAGNPFPLGTVIDFSDYNGSTGGTYRIPLKARFYETGPVVGAGSATAEMTFTMTYL